MKLLLYSIFFKKVVSTFASPKKKQKNMGLVIKDRALKPLITSSKLPQKLVYHTLNQPTGLFSHISRPILTCTRWVGRRSHYLDRSQVSTRLWKKHKKKCKYVCMYPCRCGYVVSKFLLHKVSDMGEREREKGREGRRERKKERERRRERENPHQISHQINQLQKFILLSPSLLTTNKNSCWPEIRIYRPEMKICRSERKI